MTRAKTIWVVVADEAIARILEWPRRGSELVPVEELTDPAAHAKGTDVLTDAVAQRLDERLRQQRFDGLRIAAAPRFLGLLRKHLSPQVNAVVQEETDKDLIHASNEELSERLMSEERAERRAAKAR